MKVQLTFGQQVEEVEVTITTDHPQSSYGQPVVMVDGGGIIDPVGFGLCKGKVLEGTEEERRLFLRWGKRPLWEQA